MTNNIFFSWQSDLGETRNVIWAALDKAVRSVNSGVALEEAMRVDQDTDGVAGWPEITSSILEKIERCEVFVADITPINGPQSSFRLTPNPNVLFELGYALATGLGRTRIICVVNSAYLPGGDLKELPFDVRGSRPLAFALEDPASRGSIIGQEDSVRIIARGDLTKNLERSLIETFNAIGAERANRILDVTPHLATDNLEKFHVILDVKTHVPFQVEYLVKEPSGTVLSGLMMRPASVDPKGKTRVRFTATTLKPLKPGNDVYVLSGTVAHVQSEKRPVPLFHPFEVHYQTLGKTLVEITRQQPPPH